MPKVIWPPRVVRQLSSIAAFIRVDDPVAAERMVAKLWSAGESLADFPRRGRPVPDGIRELATLPPYVIRYEVDGDSDVVTILSIRHGARRPLD